MDEQKRPRAWVYARIPGDYDGTMNSYKFAQCRLCMTAVILSVEALTSAAAGCCAPATAI